jgi:hypothetical protein
MDSRPGTEQLGLTAKALRFTVWQLDMTACRAAGADPADMPPCPVADGELPALAAPLAVLVTAARRALAENLGIEGAEAQTAAARAFLLNEIENCELSAAFAETEAELLGGS